MTEKRSHRESGKATYRLGVDVGGTFTDFILMLSTGALAEEKVPSRPHHPGEALREGIERLSERVGETPAELLENCEVVVHGTTVATNAVIQGTVGRTGLICTEGFRDTLWLRDGYKENRYDLAFPPPSVLVPRPLRLSVRERVAGDGRILIPLDEEDARRKLASLRDEQVEAVAVCFVWSTRNGAHERRLKELVREELPNAYASASIDVLPEVRYYDRLSTTVLNAALGPIVVPYLEMIEDELATLGYRGPTRFMQSNGGVVSSSGIKNRPVLALNSGPAAGPAAGVFFSKAMVRKSDVLSIDMGGTSFDVCVVENGTPTMTKNVDVHRYRLGIAMVEVNTVGAGGGSIASIEAGLLRVGPESAEAVPGPACYGKGGTLPTVCDADVILGYLNPVALLGGRFPIDRDAAEDAVRTHVAEPLNISETDAAWAIFGLVNHRMADAIREMSVERGRDPRDFTIVAAGGCGPVHAAAIARELGINQVIVPQVAPTFCAFGAAVADLRYDRSRGYMARLNEIELGELNGILAEMEQEVRENLAEDGVPRKRQHIQRRFDMRYVGQTHECSIDLPAVGLNADSLERLRLAFDQKHESLFTYSEPEADVEAINVCVAGLGRASPPRRSPSAEAQSAESPEHVAESDRTRPVVFGRGNAPIETPVLSGDAWQSPVRIDGPAIIEERNTAIVVPPAGRAIFNGDDAYLVTIDVEVQAGPSSKLSNLSRGRARGTTPFEKAAESDQDRQATEEGFVM